MSRSEPRHLVLVGYHRERTERAIRLCERAFAGLRMDRRLVVANSDEALSARLPAGWKATRGSNRQGEFSGWQEGLDALGTNGRAAALLVNDTVGDYRYMSLFRRWALRHEILDREAGWVGFVERKAVAQEQLTIGDFDCREWASTYCFFMPREALSALSGTLYDADLLRRLVPGGPTVDRFFSDEISHDLQRHLADWLFEGGWSRSAPLDAGNADALAFKARCICAEMLLSSRIQRLGVPLRDPMRRHQWAARLERANGFVRARLGAMRARPTTP